MRFEIIALASGGDTGIMEPIVKIFRNQNHGILTRWQIEMVTLDWPVTQMGCDIDEPGMPGTETKGGRVVQGLRWLSPAIPEGKKLNLQR